MQKRAVKTRESIISNTEALIAKHGIESVNTNMIAEKAGISVGSIYTHFKNKWEIFLIILEEHSNKVYTFGKKNMDRVLKENLTFKEAVELIIPGLYRINKRNGKLNSELEKFIQTDKRAAAIHKKWEKMEDRKILSFLESYSDSISISDMQAAAEIINLQLRVVFYHLYNNRNKKREKVIISQFVEMLLNSVIKRR